MISTDLSIHGHDGYTVVALRGELDLADAPYVVAVLMAVTTREPYIVADLTALDFIDSSGVKALVSGSEQARQAGGDLLLAAPQPQVTRILCASRLAHSFAVYDSAEAAANSIGSAESTVVVPLRPSRQAKLVPSATPATRVPCG